MTVTAFTIEELDAMSEDAFYGLANDGSEYQLDHPVENLSDDYQRFVESLEGDVREAFVESGGRTAFAMYAEMRINGFERQPAAALTP